MSRVKEQLDQLGALVLDAAEQISAENAVTKILVEPGSKKEVAATNLLRCLLMSVQAYHGKAIGTDGIVQVICDILVLAYDVSATTDCMDVVLSKTAPLYAKLTILRAMAQLEYAQIAAAGALLPELLSLTTKHIRHADLYVRHTLLAALASMLRQFSFHAVPYHAEVTKLVAKATTDKCPEVRHLSGEILFVLIDATDMNEPSGAALDGLFHVLSKALDDPSPEVRRVMAVNFGKLLSLYVLRGDRHGDDADHRFKSLNFKLSTVLTRKTKTPSGLASVPHALQYIKETLLLGTSSSIGGSFASAAIVAANLSDFLPDDFVADTSYGAILDALLSWLDAPLPSTHEFVRARNAVGYALRRLAHAAQERSQPSWLRALLSQLQVSARTHHQRLVLLVEVSHATMGLGEAAVVFADEATQALTHWLSHEKHSVRVEAGVALASLAVAVPYRRQALLDALLTALASAVDAAAVGADTLLLYRLHGTSNAVAHLLRALKLQAVGFSRSLYDRLLVLAERMLTTQFTPQVADAVWLTCTRGGWDVLSALVVLDAAYTRSITSRLSHLWLQASVSQARDPSQELLRMEGAVIALYSFMATKPTTDGLDTLCAQLLHATLEAAAAFGTPTKQRAKVAKHRVLCWTIKVFQCLPPSVYADSWMRLLDLVAEFTTAQPLTSLARASLVPPSTTYLQSHDHVLDICTPARLAAGDAPDPMLPRGLNLILALLLPDTALSDIEMETTYVDNFFSQLTSAMHAGSAFTYVRMVDACVHVFPGVFLAVPDELQLRVLQHFAGVLGDHRVDCVANVCALLFATVREAHVHVRDSTKTSASFQSAPWLGAMQAMLLEMLSAPTGSVRRSAAEALGLLGSLASEAAIRALVNELETKITIDQHDNQSLSLAGSALALAHLKRSCGSRCSIDVNLLFRINMEHVFCMAQPIRSWVLHAWNLLLECVNTSGDYDDQYVAPSLALIESHLVAGTRFTPLNCAFKKTTVLRMTSSVCTSLGQIVNSIVSALGPELLQDPDRIDNLYGIWDLLRLGADPRVELEYLRFVEQLVLFAPAYFRVSDLVRIQSQLLEKTTPAACRSVMLLIVRILVEREPGFIAGHSLHVTLFQALDVHERILDWSAMPLWRGLYIHARRSTTSASSELQGCLNALLLTDCGRVTDGNKVAEWLLLCRGVAVGGVTAMVESPRGKDANAAMDLWRRTSHRVSTLLNPLPCLRRRVREFAVTCVLALLDHVGASKAAAVHFDVMAARQALGADDANYIALYIDELVTLGCQISAMSMDGFELQHIQSVGLRLLNVVCEKLATCDDPDEPGAHVLAQYQAQLSSTIRRAFPKEGASSKPFCHTYEALSIQGYYMLSHILSHGIVKDKVAINRLVKLGLVSDFTFAHLGCSNAVRFTLAMAALSSVAQLASLGVDVASMTAAWVASIQDFSALVLLAGPSDFGGAYFTSSQPIDELRSVALAHVAPILAAVGATGEHGTLVLTATLLHLSHTSKHADAAVPLLQSLPALLNTGFWASLQRESFENLLQTLGLFCSSSVPSVQVEALRGLQLLVTKDGAAFVQRTLRTESDSVGNSALVHTISVATTYVLRHAVATKTTTYAPSVVTEALRTAVGGILLLVSTPTFGAGFVLVAKDVLLRFLREPWFETVGAAYIESTLRVAAAGDLHPTLPSAFATFLAAIQTPLTDDASLSHGERRLLLSAAHAVLTYGQAMPAFVQYSAPFHTSMAQLLAIRIADTNRDVVDDALYAARVLSDCAPAPYLSVLGAPVVDLLSFPEVDAARVDAIDGVLGVAMLKMPVESVDGLLRLLLPLLLPLHSSQTASVNRMLVTYATTYAVAFKAAVAGLSPSTKTSLEGALRSALSRPVSTATVAASSSPLMSLDLSRYG
ncbi:hypothetical protein SPRG_10621 [Saprolegnia parasitica CBS 223.65]|uniref:Uncharacterized protein n=1 Tax=Saprolegnia parasitica (strain CBS 223.65) TaxID=695850 RepID=A0A067CBP0_SAPPC|nr:hypothetical protein SPRG_10621 [Saprolegnia parasitica CBS 223.65]KDO24192.1 hypothetical protein SPRG_10621 [Saprolegnia parasitica CBS 223.65]|eukprot:XP_012205136.1 hypothetical protein SPRG_10621 [Saprolegnia parasitica CBS 223.65]